MPEAQHTSDLRIRRNHTLTEELFAEVVQRHHAGETACSISRSMELRYTTVLEWLHETGNYRQNKRVHDANGMESMRREGKTIYEIAVAHHTAQETVTEILKARGFDPWSTLEHSKALSAHAPEMVALYRSGKSSPRIGRIFGCCDATVCRLISAAGEPIRNLSTAHKLSHLTAKRVRNIDDSCFDRESEERDYWVGMIMADGWVTDTKQGKRALGLSLSAPDDGHIEKLKAFMRSEHKVGHTLNNAGTPTARIGVVCKGITDTLARFGVLPRKSLTAKVVGLEHSRHFWRGVIDGDGALGFQMGKYPRLQLVGSIDLMSQFVDFVATNLGMRPPVRQDGKVFRVSVSGKRGADLVRVLYGRCLIALDRKLAIANLILAASPKV